MAFRPISSAGLGIKQKRFHRKILNWVQVAFLFFDSFPVSLSVLPPRSRINLKRGQQWPSSTAEQCRGISRTNWWPFSFSCSFNPFDFRNRKFFLCLTFCCFFFFFSRRSAATGSWDRTNDRMPAECAAAAIPPVRSCRASSRSRNCHPVTIWWPSCPKAPATSTSPSSNPVATI